MLSVGEMLNLACLKYTLVLWFRSPTELCFLAISRYVSLSTEGGPAALPSKSGVAVGSCFGSVLRLSDAAAFS